MSAQGSTAAFGRAHRFSSFADSRSQSAAADLNPLLCKMFVARSGSTQILFLHFHAHFYMKLRMFIFCLETRLQRSEIAMPAKDGSLRARQATIRKILAVETVYSQVELQRLLNARGFKVAQSSVSRDLMDLGVVKVGGRYALRESLASDAGSADELSEVAASILAVEAAGPYLLVVHTPPGRAAAVGLAIDRAGWREVVGTVAGDDTLLVATRRRREQAAVEARLEKVRRKAGHA